MRRAARCAVGLGIVSLLCVLAVAANTLIRLQVEESDLANEVQLGGLTLRTLHSYQRTHGSYPTTLSDLDAQSYTAAGPRGSRAEWHYRVTADRMAFALGFRGPDGACYQYNFFLGKWDRLAEPPGGESGPPDDYWSSRLIDPSR